MRLPVFAKLGDMKFRVVMLDVAVRSWTKSQAELCCRITGPFSKNAYWKAGGDLWASAFDGVALHWDGKTVNAGNGRPIEAMLNSGAAQAPSPVHGLATDLHKKLMGEDKAPPEFFVDGNADASAKMVAWQTAPDIADRFCLVDDRLMMRSFGPAYVATRRPRNMRDACYALKEGPGGYVRGGAMGVYGALDEAEHVRVFQERLTDFWGDEAELEILSPWRDESEQYLAVTVERLLWSFLELVERRSMHDVHVLDLVLAVRSALDKRWPTLHDDCGLGMPKSIEGVGGHLFGRHLPDALPLLPLARRIVDDGRRMGLSSELPAWGLALEWIEHKTEKLAVLRDLEGFEL